MKTILTTKQTRVLIVLLMQMCCIGVYADGVTFTATGSNVEGYENETYLKAFDGVTDNKWCGNFDSDNGVYVEFQSSSPITLTDYCLYTGNDVLCDGSNRNPKSWKLMAKAKPEDEWTVISEVAKAKLPRGNSLKSDQYDVDSEFMNTIFSYFRFQFDEIEAGSIFEIGEIVIDVCKHEYDGGGVICKKCGYIMKHEHVYAGQYKAICSLCGKVKSHAHQTNNDDVCTLCGNTLYARTLFQSLCDGRAALDGNLSTSWKGHRFEFETSIPVSVRSYTIVSATKSHGYIGSEDIVDWKLFGRNEGSDQWVELSSVVDGRLPSVAGVESDEYVIEDFSSTYKFFAFQVEKNAKGGDTGEIVELKLNYNNIVDNDGVMNSDSELFGSFSGNETYWAAPNIHDQEYSFAAKGKMKITEAKVKLGRDVKHIEYHAYFELYGVSDKERKLLSRYDWDGQDYGVECNLTLSEAAADFYKGFVVTGHTESGDELRLVDITLKYEVEKYDPPVVADVLVYRTSTRGLQDHSPELIFDGDTSTYGSASISSSNSDTWGVEWRYKEPKAISSYTLTPGINDDCTPVSWKLWGRNTPEEDWILLSEVYSFEMQSGTESQMFTAENLSLMPFKCFWLEIGRVKKNNTFELAEINVLTSCGSHDYSGAYAKKCTKCGFVDAHQHDDNFECSLCGKHNPNYLYDYVGGETYQNNVKWIYNIKANELTFEGNGIMAKYDPDRNSWHQYNDTIKSITIGEGITSIGNGSEDGSYFLDMEKLTNISLPSTLKNIGDYAFEGCSGLKAIVLPEGLETIGSHTFKNVGLTSIDLPSSLVSIGDYALEYSMITEIALPANLTDIGMGAFYGCTGLTEVTFPTNVKTIGKECFKGCSSIEKLTFEGPKSIAKAAFENCWALKVVYLKSDEPMTGTDSKAFTPKDVTLYVQNPIYDYAVSERPWSDFGTILPFNNVEMVLNDGSMQCFNFDTETSDDNVLEVTDADTEKLRVYKEIPMKQFTYNRIFTNTNWQPWVMPIDVVLTDELLERFAFARVSGGLERENGDLYVAFANVKPGETVKANVPYVIKAVAADEQTPQTFSYADMQLKVTAPVSFTTTSSTLKFTFAGTYNAVTTADFEDPIYVMAEGAFHPLADGAALSPLRFYMQIEPRDDDPYRGPSGIDFYLPISKDNPTDIFEVTDSAEQSDGKFLDDNIIVIRHENKAYNVVGLKIE